MPPMQPTGVTLSKLVPENGQQTDLLGYSTPGKQSDRLMDTMDNINSRYKRSTIHLASEGTARTFIDLLTLESPVIQLSSIARVD